MTGHKQRLMSLARERGVLRARDLEPLGLPRQYLGLLLDEGRLERVGRGTYVLPDADVTEHHSLAQVAARVPHGVVCLLSALRFHNIGTQLPFEVWLAIGEKSRQPRVEYPPLRIVRFSGEARTYGIETHRIENVAVHVYSPAKTVADCFKYRNKIGIDVAIEALRETWRARRATMDELWRAAGACRMQRVMEPYLLSLT